MGKAKRETHNTASTIRGTVIQTGDINGDVIVAPARHGDIHEETHVNTVVISGTGSIVVTGDAGGITQTFH